MVSQEAFANIVAIPRLDNFLVSMNSFGYLEPL